MVTVLPPAVMTFHLVESTWSSSKSSQKSPGHAPCAASGVASLPASRGAAISPLASWIGGIEPPLDPPFAVPALPAPPCAPPVPCPPVPPDPDDEPTAGAEASLDASPATVGPDVESRLHPAIASDAQTKLRSERFTATSHAALGERALLVGRVARRTLARAPTVGRRGARAGIAAVRQDADVHARTAHVAAARFAAADAIGVLH